MKEHLLQILANTLRNIERTVGDPLTLTSRMKQEKGMCVEYAMVLAEASGQLSADLWMLMYDVRAVLDAAGVAPQETEMQLTDVEREMLELANAA